MYNIFEAILPVFSLIILGLLFKRWHFPADSFWKNADRITYHVFLPALIIEKLAIASFDLQDFYELSGIMTLSILLISLMVILVQKFFSIEPASFTSVFQGAIRPNTYIALAAAAALFGDEGVAYTAVIMVGIIPLVNILCIIVFSISIPQSGNNVLDLFKNVIKNPLVLACFLGMLLNITGVGLPYVSHDIFLILSIAALPLGLISVGFGLNIVGSKGLLFSIIETSLIKLVALPIISYLLLKTVTIEEVPRAVIILFSSLPCAVSSYILSGQLNGDQKLMATIITIETILAIVTMPLLLYYLL